MSAGLYPAFQFFDNNGEPLNGGLVYTYEPGTTTPKASYQDAALTTPQANPIVLSAFGRPPAPIWLNGETKVVVKTAAEVTLDTVDNVNAGIAGLAGWATKQDGVILKSANYDLTAADDGKTLVATSGSWTLGTADAASIMGEGFVIDFLNAGSGVITLDPNGAETVNGESTASLGPGDGGRLVCDGANWRLMRSRNISRSGLKNRIINGDFIVDQRNGGTAQAITSSNAYGPDRWFVVGNTTALFPSGPANCTVQVGTLSPAGNGPGVGFSMARILRSSGTYNGNLSIAQAIETLNCADLQGQTVTLSFKARRGSGYNGQTFAAAIRTGTGVNEGNAGLSSGSWAGYQQNALNTWILTTSWQTFSITGTIQAGALEVGVYFITGAFTGTGSANDYVDITDVQLEVGSVPTEFERISGAAAVALCERYYERGFSTSNQFRVYGAGSNEIYYFGVRYRTLKRVVTTPTISNIGYANGGSASLGGSGLEGFNISYLGTGGVGQHGISFDWQVGSEI